MKKKRFLSPLFILICLLAGHLFVTGTGYISHPANAAGNAPIHEFPFEIVSNKPWVQVRVNDGEPLWFILDTGSGHGSIIDRGRALKLGLDLGQGESGHLGAGEGTEIQVAWTGGVDFDIHGLTLVNQAAMVIPLDHVSPYEGRCLDGTLGYNFLSLYIVEIDYAAGIIRLYDPATYAYSGPGAVIPFSFQNGLIFAGATVSLLGGEPIHGSFIIDTGTRMTILFNSPFLIKHGLLDTDMKLLPGTLGGGVGGECKGYVGRIDKLQIGNLLAKEPVASFSTDKSGVTASDAFDGIIGGGLLHRCRTIFDYSRKQLILEPNAPSPVPYEYDMSGLFLVGEGEDFKRFIVKSVMERSPADEAGLQRGDVINAIDGHPSDEFTLEQIRQLFRQNECEILVEIKREDDLLQVSLKLRRLI